MLFRRRIGSTGSELETVALRERIKRLEAVLARHEAAAAGARRRYALAAITGIMLFGSGFALGLYGESLKQTAEDWAVTFGLAPSRSHSDAAHAAHQRGDYGTALQLLRPLAEQGDARAQAALGEIYYHGRGVPRNDAEAIRLFRLAADQGNALAQLHLGVAYAEGHSVPQDHGEAAKWYRLAANQGDAQAMYNIGLAYAKGEGVALDNVQAHVWFNLAAARFSAADPRNRNLATKNRDLVAGKMTPEEIAKAQKLAREWKPS